MNFGNLRVYSVRSEIKKKFRMPSGKHRMHSVSGRHNFRSLPSRYGNCRSACRHRTMFFEVHYTPVTLNMFCEFVRGSTFRDSGLRLKTHFIPHTVSQLSMWQCGTVKSGS